MNDLQIFENQDFGEIRTLERNGEPWFAGKDVAIALGYRNPRDALAKRVDDEDKGVAKCDTLGGTQEIVIINESGMYALILSSKLPSAKKFKRWVTSEVLPAIRRRGAYANQRALTPDDYLKAASIIASCDNERLPYVLDFLNQAGIRMPTTESPILDSADIPEILKRYSLDDAARKTGINRTSIYYYRKGVRKPPQNRVETIISILG